MCTCMKGLLIYIWFSWAQRMVKLFDGNSLSPSMLKVYKMIFRDCILHLSFSFIFHIKAFSLIQDFNVFVIQSCYQV